MTVRKRILVESRLRKPPSDGWSWIDRRFLQEHAPALSREATLLYFFLAAVSDKHGLSFYSDTTISARLRIEEVIVERARDELEARDLIVYQPPLYQVLSIRSPGSRRRDTEETVVGELLGRISEEKRRRRSRSRR